MNLYIRMDPYHNPPILPPGTAEIPRFRAVRIDTVVRHFLIDVCPVFVFEVCKDYCFTSVPQQKLGAAIQALDGKFFKLYGAKVFRLRADKARPSHSAPRSVGYKQNLVHEIGRRYDGNARCLPH